MVLVRPPPHFSKHYRARQNRIEKIDIEKNKAINRIAKKWLMSTALLKNVQQCTALLFCDEKLSLARNLKHSSQEIFDCRLGSLASIRNMFLEIFMTKQLHFLGIYKDVRPRASFGHSLPFSVCQKIQRKLLFPCSHVHITFQKQPDYDTFSNKCDVLPLRFKPVSMTKHAWQLILIVLF